MLIQSVSNPCATASASDSLPTDRLGKPPLTAAPIMVAAAKTAIFILIIVNPFIVIFHEASKAAKP